MRRSFATRVLISVENGLSIGLIQALATLVLVIPLKQSQGWGGHLHTLGHYGDTQGLGAPDLSDDQGWAPAPTYACTKCVLLL